MAKKSTDSGLTDVQAAALAGMMAGRKLVELAAELGITPETLSRWRAEPVFAAEHNRRRREVSELAGEQLRQLQGAALAVLGDQLQSADGRERVAAARAILSVAPVQIAEPGPDDEEALRLTQARTAQNNLLDRMILGI